MRLAVVFSGISQKINVRFSRLSQTFAAGFGDIQTITKYVGGEAYIGDYTVTPKVVAQTMPTKGKVLTDDVTIHAIPRYDVSNTSGGKTIYIANEV